MKHTFFAPDRETWRAWLERHHASADQVWLLFTRKRTGRPRLSLAAAVEEALCFGWIDGKVRHIDDRSHAYRFTPRRPRSPWSALNRSRAERLIAEGRMAPAGLRRVEEARRDGRWARARPRKRPSAVPPDLAAALDAEPKARTFFEELAPSYRRLYLAWVLDAKRPETRTRRVATVVSRSAQKLRPSLDM